MDDPAKFRALIEAANQTEHDEIFERLARGELSDAEVATLRDSPDPQTQHLYELFRPLDATARQRFDTAVASAFPARAVSELRPATAHPSARRPRRPLRRQLWVGGLMLAAAAAVLLYLAPRGRVPDPLQIASLERVVQHNAAGSSYLGTADTPQPQTELSAGSCWHVELSVPPTGQLPAKVQAYFVQGSTAVAWPIDWSTLPTERFAPSGGCAKLPALAAGTWDFVILSGSNLPSSTPQEAASACHRGPPVGAPWRCDKKAILISAPLPSSR